MKTRLITSQHNAIAAEVGGRISEALTIAGLSIGQAARMLCLERGLVLRWAAGEQLPVELHHLVDLAQLCLVDPRWLAQGVFSGASASAVAAAQRAFDGKRITEQDRGKIIDVLQRATVQPASESGICRYCHCMQNAACDDGGKGCHWVDDVATICSACVRPIATEREE